jgi:prophage regulatory protein
VNDRILSRTDLREKGITVSKPHLHRLINAGQFPRPFKVTPGRNGWLESEVDQYLADRIAARGGARSG